VLHGTTQVPVAPPPASSVVHVLPLAQSLEAAQPQVLLARQDLPASSLLQFAHTPLVPQVPAALALAQVPEVASQQVPLHSASLVQKVPQRPSRQAWPARHSLELVHWVFTQ